MKFDINTIEDCKKWEDDYMIENFPDYPNKGIRDIIKLDDLTTCLCFDEIRQQIIAESYCFNEDAINDA